MSGDNTQEEMLEELRKIREAMEPKPTPPPPPPKGFMAEFIDFLNKHGVIGLAIAVIIGGAAGNLISALVGDILMPIITPFIPEGAWRAAVLTLGSIRLSIGHFTGALLDFLIMALVVYFLMKQLAKTGLK